MSIAIVGIVVGLSIQFAGAWTAPGSAAPNGDVTAPVLTNGNQDVTIKNLVVTDSIKLGGVKRNIWPQAYEPGIRDNFTVGTTTNWEVPYGVNKLHIEAWGGGGGGAMGRYSQGLWWTNHLTITSGGSGASGAYVRADMPVKAGEILKITVGNGGAGSARLDHATPSIYSIGGGGTYTTVEQIQNGSYVAVLTANGGLGGYDHDDWYNVGGYILCDTANSRVRAAKGLASSSLPGADLKNGKDGNYCIMGESYFSDGYWSDGTQDNDWQPIWTAGSWSPANVSRGYIASPGAIQGLDAPFGAYGDGGRGAAWGDGPDPAVAGAAKAEDGQPGKIIITY
ncbi:MAG: hypothetical protein US63_C0031G0007 [Candidatus Moranbacteria bacterium GW2011_GWC2_37_8]|nr:MAG: hypothetical protein US63_C0031G0007 [Candidatus Moranbacteria bacterium GW2011_GWC2_37_8]KKQ61611.1 MAG: hypothetical protein US82_C0020G0006 [Parcubacteria group bacterium GW2011_GWC1_38_22]KKQ80887.1 MAG: hypothetical protein UT03_C0017G0002 [Candidatus Moranbacteria bacterium GW2011_GWD2_38_7]